ncbi:MAG: acylneuraminate cytidylyltransferase family protein [Minisyncoccia bacterium]
MSRPKVIGVVPARSKSEGIPNKNIKLIAGKPLLAWAIEAGKKSGVLDKVILMTDSKEYAEVGKKYGAEVPWLQPAEFATDTSHVFLALKWLVGELIKSGEKPDYIVLLEPTAPARQPAHIRELVKLVTEGRADSGFTVLPVPPGHNAHWQFSIDDKGKAHIVTGEPVTKIIRRRQLLPTLFVRGGSTYISKTECLLKDEPDMYGEDARALVIDPKYALDLDNEEDWREAEKILPTLVK